MANAQSTALVALLPTIFAPPRNPTIKATPAKSSSALCRPMRELLSPARMNVSSWFLDTTDRDFNAQAFRVFIFEVGRGIASQIALARVYALSREPLLRPVSGAARLTRRKNKEASIPSRQRPNGSESPETCDMGKGFTQTVKMLACNQLGPSHTSRATRPQYGNLCIW